MECLERANRWVCKEKSQQACGADNGEEDVCRHEGFHASGNEQLDEHGDWQHDTEYFPGFIEL